MGTGSTTGSTVDGVDGADGTDGAMASTHDARRARRAARAARADARAAWTGGRWWLPGTVAAVVTAVAGWLGTEAGAAFTAAGCGERGAKFECLGAGLLFMAVAPVAGPLLLWLLYHLSGVRRSLLGVPVAAVVALCLVAAPELVRQVRLLGGVHPGEEVAPAPFVGVLLGLAVLGGGLALQGPRVVVRGVAAVVALGLLLISALVLSEPSVRARTALDLERATVPLLLPDAGWQPSPPYVDDDGDLSYDAVPVGWTGYGFEGVTVDVDHDLDRFGDTCSFRACVDSADVRVEVPEATDAGGVTAWRLVDGVLVTVSSTDGDPAVDPVAFLQGMSAVTTQELLERLFLR